MPLQAGSGVSLWIWITMAQQQQQHRMMRMRLIVMKEKIKELSHLKSRAMIKGEMPMIKMRKMNKFQGRHTQESTKQFNEITL